MFHVDLDMTYLKYILEFYEIYMKYTYLTCAIGINLLSRFPLNFLSGAIVDTLSFIRNHRVAYVNII